jgi:heme oxygenase
MADQTLLAKARKARFDDLPNFSGHSSDDAEQFIKCIKKLTKVNNDSEDYQILEIVRGKLVQSAGKWFDNNESIFHKWSDFEQAFRNRYFLSTAIHKKFDTLKQRKQSIDESVTTYIDDVINLCRDIDPDMSDQIIIHHLMSGLNFDIRKELSRRESCMTKLNEFIKQAKVEQDLHDTFENSRQLPVTPDYNHSMAHSLTNMIKQPKPQNYHTRQHDRHSYPVHTQNSAPQRNSSHELGKKIPALLDQPIQKIIPRSTSRNKTTTTTSTQNYQFDICKICGRRNHRMIDCFYKRTTGCFKCGQNHMARDCTQLQNFQ